MPAPVRGGGLDGSDDWGRASSHPEGNASDDRWETPRLGEQTGHGRSTNQAWDGAGRGLDPAPSGSHSGGGRSNLEVVSQHTFITYRDPTTGQTYYAHQGQSGDTTVRTASTQPFFPGQEDFGRYGGPQQDTRAQFPAAPPRTHQAYNPPYDPSAAPFDTTSSSLFNAVKEPTPPPVPSGPMPAWSQIEMPGNSSLANALRFPTPPYAAPPNVEAITVDMSRLSSPSGGPSRASPSGSSSAASPYRGLGKRPAHPPTPPDVARTTRQPRLELPPAATTDEEEEAYTRMAMEQSRHSAVPHADPLFTAGASTSRGPHTAARLHPASGSSSSNVPAHVGSEQPHASWPRSYNDDDHRSVEALARQGLSASQIQHETKIPLGTFSKWAEYRSGRADLPGPVPTSVVDQARIDQLQQTFGQITATRTRDYDATQVAEILHYHEQGLKPGEIHSELSFETPVRAAGRIRAIIKIYDRSISGKAGA